MAAVEAAPSETDGVDPIRVTCLPARDPWIGSDPAWGQGCVNTHPALRPHQGVSEGGRSRPRPQVPDRHRRSGGRGATARRPATCASAGAHMEAAFSCTSTPMSMCTRRSAPSVPDRGVDIVPCETRSGANCASTPQIPYGWDARPSRWAAGASSPGGASRTPTAPAP